MVDAALCIVSGLLLLMFLGKKKQEPDDDAPLNLGDDESTGQISPDQWPQVSAALAQSLVMFPSGSLARAGAVKQFQSALGLPITGIYTSDVQARMLSGLQALDPTLTLEDLPPTEINVG